MLKIAKTEFYKLKRYSVVWIGVATMLTVVLLTRFMATASDGAVHTLEYFSNSVIWNNFSLIFPATITLIAGYIIERERVDDTLKNILTIPIPFRKLLAGKLIAVGGLAIILAAIEFVFTMIIFFISRFPGFSFAGMILALVRMIGMNLFVYVAVLPIIVFTGQRAGSFMAGVGFSFFYGFVGTFASGHGLGNIYPVTAGLGLINYQGGETAAYNIFLSTGILLLMFTITSGTLKAGNGFSRTRQENGLGKEIRVMEYVAESPFAYEKNCLLYLPQTLRRTKHGSREEAVMMAQHIQRLICSTYGHTLVLFTSYSLMGSVYQILRDSLPFPMVEVWRNAQEEIMRFKTMENAVLFAAGSCWEGVDFPGDIVSSLIIVKLPFAVPDPLREAEKERYATLTEYIRDIIVPDMQKKLRQGFGRAIRTESDTCVVSILDHRAVAGGRYHEDVLCALPACQMAETIEDVETFIRRQKCEEYYM